MKNKSFILAATALLTIFSTGCDPVEDPKEEPKAAPEITGIAPAYGYAGDEVTIKGKNFSATASENEVLFGEDAATVAEASETSLKVVVPGDENHAAGKVTVKVTVAGQSAESSFTYIEPEPDPIVATSIDPAKGPAGTEVTITGENFGDSAEGLIVAFGPNAAEIKSVSNTSIVAVAPAGEGEVQVIVSRGDLMSEALMYRYEYSREVTVSSIWPLLATEGEEIAVVGTGFSPNADENVVTIGGVPAQVLSASETEGLLVVVPTLAKGEYTIDIATVGAAPVKTSPFVYWSLPSYTVSTVIGDGTAKNLEGAWTAAQVQLPEGLCWGPDGKLWITTRGGSGAAGAHAIHSVDMATGQMTTVFDQTVIGENHYPWGLDFNSKGELHVCLKAKSLFAKIVDGNYETYSISGTTIKTPMNLVFDSNDYMYVADRDNKRIVVAHNGEFVKEYPLACGEGTFQPYTVALDPKEENLFVGTNGGRRLLKVNISTGEVTKLAGVATSDPNKDLKPAADNITDGEVGNPMTAVIGSVSGIVVDTDGYVYFNDMEAFTLRVLIPGVGGDYTAGMVKTLAGQPCSSGFADGDGLAEAKFAAQGMLLKDAEGAFYVSGGNANRIRKVTPVK